MRGLMPMDLSVVIVNYRSASYTLHAVSSALEQEVVADGVGGGGSMEVLVIDNGSSSEDAALLEGLPRQARLIRNEANVGFAAAANQGIREARGQFICLLNPDTHLFPGALQRLLDHLRCHPEVAAAGPKAWWDEERTFLLPFVRLPTPGSMIVESLAGLDYRIGRSLCRSWHRRDLTLWRSVDPMTIDMLCGACLVIRREVLDQVGGFDPAYHLYYEDADWCRRVRARGFRLAYVPAAEIVHYYNQSAQSAGQQRLEWMVRSRRYYLERQFGPRRAALCGRVDAVAGRLAGRWRAAPPRSLSVDLGPQQEPPLFSYEEGGVEGDVLFEASHHWTFVFKAAAFRPTPALRLPLPIWKRLQPGRYYTRLTGLATSSQERIWSWQKV